MKKIFFFIIFLLFFLFFSQKVFALGAISSVKAQRDLKEPTKIVISWDKYTAFTTHYYKVYWEGGSSGRLSTNQYQDNLPEDKSRTYTVHAYDQEGNDLAKGSVTLGGTTSPTTETSPLPLNLSFQIIDWSGGFLKNLGKDNPVAGLLINIINWFLYFAGGLAVIAIIYSGIMYITSSGNPEKAQKAKSNLVWAIIGLLVILLALAIPNLVYDILTKEVKEVIK